MKKKVCPYVKCFNCQEVGHKVTNCPRKSETAAGKIYSVTIYSKLMTKEVNICGKSVVAMVISGAAVSVIKLKTYISLGSNSQLTHLDMSKELDQ